MTAEELKDNIQDNLSKIVIETQQESGFNTELQITCIKVTKEGKVKIYAYL